MSEVAVDADPGGRMQSLKVGEVKAALKDRNPRVPSKDLHSVAVLAAQVVEFCIGLTKSERLELVRNRHQFRAALEDAVHHFDVGERAHIEATGRKIKSRGTGLGKRISLAEGRARLEQFATPGPIERWAGPVVGAGQIKDQLGVGRTTLDGWRKRGVIVGLLRDDRNYAYPLEQFVDNRPLKGLAEVLRLAPDARGAWLWLRQPNGALGGRTPLEGLGRGRKEAVIKAAKEDLPFERDFA